MYGWLGFLLFIGAFLFKRWTVNGHFPIRASYVPEGNELQQYEKFINISSTEFNKYYLQNIPRRCSENTDHGELMICLKEQNKAMSNIPSFWNRKVVPNIGVLSDCSYTVDLNSSVVGYVQETGVYAQFTIHQHGCLSKCPHLGGSSFYILAFSNSYINSCGVIDNFDNTYNVTCYLPFYEQGVTIPCMSINVSVEYEHYDAFGIEVEATIFQFNLERMIIWNQKICVNDHSGIRNMSLHSILNPTHPVEANTTEDPFLRGFWSFDSSTKKPVWTSYNKIPMSQTEFDSCKSKQHLVLLGESHQR